MDLGQRRVGPSNSSSRNGHVAQAEASVSKGNLTSSLVEELTHWLPPKGETCHQRWRHGAPTEQPNEWSNSRAVSVLVHDDEQGALIGLDHSTSIDNGDARHLVTINANDINKAAGAEMTRVSLPAKPPLAPRSNREPYPDCWWRPR
jgi:hypothetical protein